MKRSTLVFAVCVLFIVSASGCNSAKRAPAPASQAQPAANMAQPGIPFPGK